VHRMHLLQVWPQGWAVFGDSRSTALRIHVRAEHVRAWDYHRRRTRVDWLVLMRAWMVHRLTLKVRALERKVSRRDWSLIKGLRHGQWVAVVWRHLAHGNRNVRSGRTWHLARSGGAIRASRKLANRTPRHAPWVTMSTAGERARSLGRSMVKRSVMRLRSVGVWLVHERVRWHPIDDIKRTSKARLNFVRRRVYGRTRYRVGFGYDTWVRDGMVRPDGIVLERLVRNPGLTFESWNNLGLLAAMAFRRLRQWDVLLSLSESRTVAVLGQPGSSRLA
jgi:hypothetical protein